MQTFVHAEHTLTVIISGKFAGTKRISSISSAEQNLVTTNVEVIAKWHSCDTMADSTVHRLVGTANGRSTIGCLNSGAGTMLTGKGSVSEKVKFTL